MYTPYELRAGARGRGAENPATPGSVASRRSSLVLRLVLHREVVTPLDIERTTGPSEGNIYAGEFLLPQMWGLPARAGLPDHRTPIHGYYQCGFGHAPRRLRHRVAGAVLQPGRPRRPRRERLIQSGTGWAEAVAGEGRFRVVAVPARWGWRAAGSFDLGARCPQQTGRAGHLRWKLRGSARRPTPPRRRGAAGSR